MSAINALGFTGLQILRVYTPPYGADNGNLGTLEAVDNLGTVFAPKQCIYQNVAVVMQNPKMQSLRQCNKGTGLYVPANSPD